MPPMDSFGHSPLGDPEDGGNQNVPEDSRRNPDQRDPDQRDSDQANNAQDERVTPEILSPAAVS